MSIDGKQDRVNGSETNKKKKKILSDHNQRAKFSLPYGKTSPELIGILRCEKCPCSHQSEMTK